jgi:hypothetical protein
MSANQKFQYNSVAYKTRVKLTIEGYDTVYIGTQVPHSLLRKYCDHLKLEFLQLTNCHFSHFSFIYFTYGSPPMLACSDLQCVMVLLRFTNFSFLLSSLFLILTSST